MAKQKLSVGEFKAMLATLGKKPPAHKYRAVRTEGNTPFGRMMMASRLEAANADARTARMAAGDIRSWIPQVSIPIGLDDAGKPLRHVIDALVIHEVRPDGTFVGAFQDDKGMDLSTGRVKRSVVSSLYGVAISLVRSQR